MENYTNSLFTMPELFTWQHKSLSAACGTSKNRDHSPCQSSPSNVGSSVFCCLSQMWVFYLFCCFFFSYLRNQLEKYNTKKLVLSVFPYDQELKAGLRWE